MKHATLATRRQFLTTAAAAAGSILLPRSSALAATDRIGKTDHFWYRLAPSDGPYVDSQLDNKAFAFGDGKVLLSEDNAKTWKHSAPFADAENIMFSSILASGNIVFATRTKIYVSTDNLKTYRELTVKGRDGSPYRPHTPRDIALALAGLSCPLDEQSG